MWNAGQRQIHKVGVCMSKVMKKTSLSVLFARVAGEYRAKDSIYEIPAKVFKDLFQMEVDSQGVSVMSARVSIPVGPAAGPHTQIAPNLLAAYLAGARVFELKTVQENDRLDIDKPCIDALDEGYNVEWSTELTLDEAREEYLDAWIAINFFARIFSHKPNDFFFNMSVGYTLDGIKSAKMDAFIEGMRRPEVTDYWEKALGELSRFVESDPFKRTFGDSALEKARTFASHVPVRPVHSVTLSTMHGCPPDEIERIGRYLIEEKGFDTYIKLNPTLIGFDETRGILDSLGWNNISLKRESFEHDLQFDMAVELINTLSETAKAKGRRFGIKLSNTLANENEGSVLPGAERYMSGRALFPITVRLAAKLARALPSFPTPFSYCGGVSALNAADLIRAGACPLTLATDILKPGGYLRLSQIAREAVNALSGAPEQPQAEAFESLARAALDRAEYKRDWKQGKAEIQKPLPLFDCFAAPCVEACPVNQKVPSYIRTAGVGENEEALATILSDNPLPHITGVLCDHICQEHCSRVDYEGPVRIRDVKLHMARAVSIPAAWLPESISSLKGAGTENAAKAKVAILGAGPAGLSCAHHLALAGIEVTVFDSAKNSGGVPANIIPRFRIAREELAADIERIESLGVKFEVGASPLTYKTMKTRGFDAVFIGTGANKPKIMKLTGSGVKTMYALEFLETFGAENAETLSSFRNVVVVGGGNTACDAVRAATRLPSVTSVCLSYRRTKREMPADMEELELALDEARQLAARKNGKESDASISALGQNGILLELTLPESARAGSITLRKMKLGEKDSSGRRAPVPTDITFDLDCDLLVSAVGEEPDRSIFEAFGVEIGTSGLPLIDPRTMETKAAGIYVGGDARKGPSSIISAEADGRTAAHAILAKMGYSTPAADYVTPRFDSEKLSHRGELLPSLPFDDPDFAKREAERCLACDSACLRCVEVCPNRANMFIGTEAPFTQDAQILHIDRLCNECGNCDVFCPYDGEPHTGKPTLFDNLEDLDASKNAGFAFLKSAGLPSLALRSIIGANRKVYDYCAWNGASSIPEDALMIALARAVWRNHPYLLEGAE
jgi:putative selenate reductase